MTIILPQQRTTDSALDISSIYQRTLSMSTGNRAGARIIRRPVSSSRESGSSGSSPCPIYRRREGSPARSLSPLHVLHGRHQCGGDVGKRPLTNRNGFRKVRVHSLSIMEEATRSGLPVFAIESSTYSHWKAAKKGLTSAPNADIFVIYPGSRQSPSEGVLPVANR